MTLFDVEVKIVAEVVGMAGDVTVPSGGAFDSHGAFSPGRLTRQLLQLSYRGQVDLTDPTDTMGEVKNVCGQKATDVIIDQLPAKWSADTGGGHHGHCFRGDAWVPCTVASGEPFESWAFPVQVDAGGGAANHFDRVAVGAESLVVQYNIIVQHV